LEQYLPLDAERMAIDVIASPKGMRTKREEGLVVVADREALETVISALEEDGKWIAGVAPKFLMGSQFWCKENGIREGHLLWQNGEQDTWDYLKLQAGRPTIRRWLDTKSAIEGVLKDTSGNDVHIVGKLPDDLRGQVEQSGHQVRTHDASSIVDWATKAERLWSRGRAIVVERQLEPLVGSSWQRQNTISKCTNVSEPFGDDCIAIDVASGVCRICVLEEFSTQRFDCEERS